MSNAIARIESTTQLATLDDIMRLGDVFAKSGYFSDAKDAAKAVVKILAGQDMGLSPFAAMNGIFLNQQGKLGYAANLIAAKIKSSRRYDYKILQWDDTICVIEFYEDGKPMGPPSSFGKADAARAGLDKKDTYRSYPKGLYFSRALTQGARAYTPELFGGNAIYTPDEIEEPPTTTARRPTTQDLVIEAEAVLDESFVLAINDIASQTNTDLAPVLKRAGVATVAELSQEQAEKTLDWLRKKAEAQQSPSEEKTQPAPSSAQEAAFQAQAPTSGLDQWLCTEQSGSRSLALNVLSVWDEALEAGIDEKTLRDGLEVAYNVTSRKRLTAEQAGDFIQRTRALIAEKGQ